MRGSVKQPVRGKIFEVPIELLVYDNANYGVPQILEVMVKYLKDHAQDTVGLFRVPGDMRVVSELRKVVDKAGYFDTKLNTVAVYPTTGTRGSSKWKTFTIHRQPVTVQCVASLIKQFLRDLPNPIITDLARERLIHLAIHYKEGSLEKDVILPRIKDTLSKLNFEHYQVLNYFCQYLHSLTINNDNDTNNDDISMPRRRMDAHGLAVCISPCLVRKIDIRNISLLNIAMGLIIENCSSVFVRETLI